MNNIRNQHLKERLKVHRIGFRLLQMIHAEDSTILPLHLLEVCVDVAKVYIGLFVTANFIDALMELQFRRAGYWIFVLLFAELLLGMVGSILKRRFKGIKTKIWLLFFVWMRQKAFSLDYETMEKPETAEKIVFSERTSDMHGGLGMLLYHYVEILRAILNILASVSMVILLCLKKPRRGNGMIVFMNEPFVSLFLFGGILIGMILCSEKCSGYFAAKREAVFRNHTSVENKLAYLMNHVFINYKVGKVIRIFEMQDMLLENGREVIKKTRNYYAYMFRLGREVSGANQIVSSVFTIFSYLLVAGKVTVDAITVGAFTQYIGALNQFGGACRDIISNHVKVEEICTYMQEFLDFLDLESQHVQGTIPVEKRMDREYELAFEDVSFHYPGSQEMVLKHVNCKLNMKKKMAVVGRNGAGKTTFIKLLCRLYEPTEGRITLNGVDIRKYREEEYRNLFSVVFQDFKLFAFSVRDNIVAGYTCDDKKVWKSLYQAGAEETVKNMPLQLDCFLYQDLEKGVEISGGEAQKIALARALYKDGALVILDEPTAALDPLAEAEMYTRFDEMVEGKTSVYISHRMSSCRFCDDIIVFDEGKIVERGNHEELLVKEDGQYAQMWKAQAQYYN